MSNDVRTTETTDAAGNRTVITDGPAELASWYFPIDGEEEQRRRLAAEIDAMIERRLAERETGAHPEEMRAETEIKIGSAISTRVRVRTTPAGLVAAAILVSSLLISAGWARRRIARM